MYSYGIILDRVRGRLGSIRLQDLTEEHVEEWRDFALARGRVRGERAGTPLSVTSVDMSLARLKEALGRGVTRRLVYVNVAAHVTNPRRARKQERELRRRGYRLMELLGLRRVRLYDARSSCFTFLANNGVADHILARWAGHTNVKKTREHPATAKPSTKPSPCGVQATVGRDSGRFAGESRRASSVPPHSMLQRELPGGRDQRRKRCRWQVRQCRGGARPLGPPRRCDIS